MNNTIISTEFGKYLNQLRNDYVDNEDILSLIEATARIYNLLESITSQSSTTTLSKNELVDELTEVFEHLLKYFKGSIR